NGNHKNGKKKFDKSNIKCYNCQKKGHFADECWSKKDQQGDEARVAEYHDEDPVMFMVTTKEEANCGDQWYLDTGCSTHMTRRKYWFTSLNQSQKSKVKFANDTTLAAEGVGAVCIKSKNGAQAIINDVLYIPGM
ncbi:retrovirus-related Pol polyprotein from transposon TNT 1-94, partial [Trifolium medium]|nr:retrovirus-related Pol polyprotein from transposon TNT 1-94 [Trifolium medium]